MTETEIVLASLTLDELREAGAYLADLAGRDIRDDGTVNMGFRRTSRTTGPTWLLEAMQLAWLREVTARYGAEQWWLGLPTDMLGEARGIVELALRRLRLNPDRKIEPPEAGSVVPWLRCFTCGVSYPRDDVMWEGWSDGAPRRCRGCATVLEGKLAELDEAERWRAERGIEAVAS